MVIKISKKASSTKIRQELKKLSGKPASTGFNAKKYFGKLVRALDGEAYQKKVRNEWN
ncbi:MAG TPA: hypothetical protein PK325_05000 [Cyclobacteriaceae bacterium]|nr:hypothetical protein [Cyclobacteriaceae bacterium]HMV11029.1 hypothetical protein [Cyclobacteriaceae bacterium]HMV88628.1 hypothetical protein [Cyclobacteriaceae bacterium]HMX00610.1 hypothetical protein [Cyclobacteriaceae bacterium]HMX49515.1 hypothetical protein [Cyclobacteriaceae bacterium]